MILNWVSLRTLYYAIFAFICIVGLVFDNPLLVIVLLWGVVLSSVQDDREVFEKSKK